MTDSIQDVLDLRFPQWLGEEFPAEYPAAHDAVETILDSVRGVDLDALALRSPALKGNDWANYLRCSMIRMAHAAAAVRRRGLTSGRVLDYGAYFGNTALMFAKLGFTVDAVDAYGTYGAVFEGPERTMKSAGVKMLSYEEAGDDLRTIAPATYDVILAMGVIEHIPHTPRLFLESLNRVLRPGGLLVIDTPNLVYLYNRQKFAIGKSVWPPLAAQYSTDPPYEGHHREYTPAELVWILGELGHTDISIELYNYSVHSLKQLKGLDLEYFWEMALDPEMREYITAVSRKPRPGEEVVRLEPARWTELLVEAEPRWATGVPPGVRQRVLGDGDPVTNAMTLELARREAELNRRADVVSATQAELDRNRREVARLFNEVTRLGEELRRQHAVMQDAVAKQQEEINGRDDMLRQGQALAQNLQTRLVAAQQDINYRDQLLDAERERFTRTIEGRVLGAVRQVGRLMRRMGLLGSR